jgi:hypothetical protein
MAVFVRAADCSYSTVMGMVLASYLQYNGTAQGAFLASEDLAPLYDTPGGRAALTVFGQLLRYHEPVDQVCCGRQAPTAEYGSVLLHCLLYRKCRRCRAEG